MLSFILCPLFLKKPRQIGHTKEVLPAFLIPMQWGPLGVGRSVQVARKPGVHHPPLPLAKILELPEERSGNYCRTKKLVFRRRFMDEEETHSIFHWKAIIWDCKSATAARLRG